ncbi:MAG: DUF2061 domain-containing protein [Bacteroidota bacterium]
MKESRTRILARGITYRCMATLATAALAWLLTGDVRTALQIGFIDFFLKLLLFYGNERLWARIRWGYGASVQPRAWRYVRLWRLKSRRIWN